MNDSATIRNATNAARSTGSRGKPRTPPPVFGILTFMATVRLNTQFYSDESTGEKV